MRVIPLTGEMSAKQTKGCLFSEKKCPRKRTKGTAAVSGWHAVGVTGGVFLVRPQANKVRPYRIAIYHLVMQILRNDTEVVPYGRCTAVVCADFYTCTGGRGNPPLRVAFHRWACEKSDRARAHNARPYGLRFAPTRFAQPSYQEKTQTTPRLMQDVVVAYFSAAFACSVSAVKAAGSAIAISESILRLRSMPAFFRPLMNEE